jgi:hypothetical protein
LITLGDDVPTIKAFVLVGNDSIPEDEFSTYDFAEAFKAVNETRFDSSFSIYTQQNLDSKTMETKVTATEHIDHSLISATAQQNWEKAGRPSGRDMEFWLAAETQLRATMKADSRPPTLAAISNGAKTKRKSSSK